ncbi:MAG: diguanylate cyclase [Ruminiclostridium sp.]
MSAITLQIFIPELLFTGAGVTIITIGIFFALENPSRVYAKKRTPMLIRERKNRACFEEDFQKYKSRIENMTDEAFQIGIIVCDLNGLKHTNDTYEHTVGDRMIAAAAAILRDELKSAKEIYRTGGDEFVAIYVGDDCRHIAEDIWRV